MSYRSKSERGAERERGERHRERRREREREREGGEEEQEGGRGGGAFSTFLDFIMIVEDLTVIHLTVRYKR